MKGKMFLALGVLGCAAAFADHALAVIAVNNRCKFTAACNFDPCGQLPLGTSCNKCTSASWHQNCSPQVSMCCNPQSADADGCGQIIDGICTNGCTGNILEDNCARTKCQFTRCP